MFGQRFKEWRQQQGFSAYRIAQLTGVHPSFLSNIEAGRRPMSESFMRRLAAIPEFGITYETLRAWEIESEYEPTAVKAAYQHVQAAEGMMEPLDGLYRLPLKMTVSAGGLTPRDEYDETVYVDWYGLKELSTDLFCLKVQGDSMWPPIPDGAVLLVRETQNLKNGEKYVIETEDDRMTFKLVTFNQAGAYLTPLNPAYTPIPLGEARVKRFYHVLSYKVDWS